MWGTKRHRTDRPIDRPPQRPVPIVSLVYRRQTCLRKLFVRTAFFPYRNQDCTGADRIYYLCRGKAVVAIRRAVYTSRPYTARQPKYKYDVLQPEGDFLAVVSSHSFPFPLPLQFSNLPCSSPEARSRTRLLFPCSWSSRSSLASSSLPLLSLLAVPLRCPVH